MNRMELQYIGACSLLGRLLKRIHDDDERLAAEIAVADCAAAFPGRFDVINADGGLLLEPRQDTPEESEK